MKLLQPLSIALFFVLPFAVRPLYGQEDVPEDQPARLCRLVADQDLWSGPSENFKKVRRAPAGLLLEIIGEKGEFYRVHVPDGFTCYVHCDYIMVDGDSMGTITGSRVNLRSIPKIEGDYPLYKVERGTRLQVWDRNGEWYRVTAPPEAYLYVPKTAVESVERNGETEKELAALRTTREESWKAGRGSRGMEQPIPEAPAGEEKTGDDPVDRLLKLEGAASRDFEGQDLEKLLEQYRALAESAPDDTARKLADARTREIAALLDQRKTEKELKDREEKWRSERDALLKQIDENKPLKPLPSTHQDPGRGRQVTVIGTVDTQGSEVILRGGKSLVDTLYRVESPDGRYILPDFNGKRISILGRIEDVAAKDTLPLIVVERIEIL